jgi:CheY-like chemotaxis protein
MRYYVLENRQPQGPFEAAELLQRPGFGAASLVCPVGATSASAWVSASSVPEISEALGRQVGEALSIVLSARAPEPEPPAMEEASPAVEVVAVEAVEPETAAAESDGAAADIGSAFAEADGAGPAEGAAAPAKGAASPADKLILVVDDDENFRTLLEANIKREGFRVMTAENGRDAGEKIALSAPDLIVTDLMMPVQGGYEFLRELQANGFHGLPVVVVTGYTLDASTLSALKLEGNVIEVMTKPINMNALVAVLHGCLKTARASPRQKLEKDDWA